MSPSQQMGELRTNTQLNAIADNRMQAVEGAAMGQQKGKVTGRLMCESVLVRCAPGVLSVCSLREHDRVPVCDVFSPLSIRIPLSLWPWCTG